jgi:hypothetical protein
MTLKGAKPRQDLRLWSSEGCGRIDQDLARRANMLGAHRGSEDREFRVHVHPGTANSETPMRSCRYGHIGTGRVDQRLSQVGLRQPRSESEIGDR